MEMYAYLENLYLGEGEYVGYTGVGITQDEVHDFYNLLKNALTNIGNGKDFELPEGTSIHGLTDFVAFEMKSKIGVKALYNLGFRTGKYKDGDPNYPNSQYCYIIHPDKRPIIYQYFDRQHFIDELWVALAKIESRHKEHWQK